MPDALFTPQAKAIWRMHRQGDKLPAIKIATGATENHIAYVIAGRKRKSDRIRELRQQGGPPQNAARGSERTAAQMAADPIRRAKRLATMAAKRAEGWRPNRPARIVANSGLLVESFYHSTPKPPAIFVVKFSDAIRPAGFREPYDPARDPKPDWLKFSFQNPKQEAA